MSGKFTRDQLMELWASVMDSAYTQPLLRGTDTGIEIIEQVAEQMARASEMIDRDGQAMFIMPSSAQTDAPAGGASRASVQLTIARTASVSQEVTFISGQVLVEVSTTDFSPDGPVVVLPGRRYAIRNTSTLVPGSMLIVVDADAETPGYGYNLPLPGTISSFVQPGTTLTNTGAQVIPGVSSHLLVMRPVPDVLGPQSVGQYVALSGANSGVARRILGYTPPPDSTTGGTVVLAATGVLAVSGVSGVFLPGEVINQASTGAAGTLIAASGGYVVYGRTSLVNFDTSGPILGVQSTATATVAAIEQSAQVTADSSSNWRVLGWSADLTLTASNDASPEGGRSPMLDELGFDRNIGRTPGELDDQYRQRVWKLPDVVSPNAVKRAANRVLAAHGSAACFREVGAIDSLFPGFFYDVSPADVGFDSRYAYAYDLDFTVRPQDRFKLVMDYLEFRAFFMIGVPPSVLGDFGFFYDVASTINFYDDAPYLSFFDGYPAVSAALNLRVWNAVDRVRMGGVSFTLYPETLGCF